MGIDGIPAYFQEGSLILLEENPDLIPLIKDFLAKEEETSNNEEAYENLRQRLLKRTKFQISFAKGRYARLNKELEGLPQEVVSVLKEKVFKYLNEQTIQKIEILPKIDLRPHVIIFGLILVEKFKFRFFEK